MHEKDRFVWWNFSSICWITYLVKEIPLFLCTYIITTLDLRSYLEVRCQNYSKTRNPNLTSHVCPYPQGLVLVQNNGYGLSTKFLTWVRMWFNSNYFGKVIKIWLILFDVGQGFESQRLHGVFRFLSAVKK